LEKIIRLVSIKLDKRFKNQNLKLGVITWDLSNISNISNETYNKFFKDLKEKFKNELESQKT
jgi:ribosomal protein L14E/L6E/L27E